MWKDRIRNGPCKNCHCPENIDHQSAANLCPQLGPPLDFVYRYIESDAGGEELRFSVRSVLKNYLGPAKIWVVGDKPDWYTGLHIPLARIEETAGRFRLDVATKFFHIATQAPEINDRFVAMQDDIYLVNPVTYYDLNRRWVNGNPLTPEKVLNWEPSNVYEAQKKLTALKLFEHGIHYVSDYSTHTPKLYFKDDLRQTIERYDALRIPLVGTILFGNAIERSDPPFPVQPYRVRLKTTDHSAESLLKACEKKIFLNHIDESWTKATRKALETLFPQKSLMEK